MDMVKGMNGLRDIISD